MTSANVIQYSIFKDEKEVGSHRENVMCKSNYESLLKYVPLKDHTIMAWGYDEEDEYWDEEPVNLETFLKKMVLFNKIIKEYFISNQL